MTSTKACCQLLLVASLCLVVSVYYVSAGRATHCREHRGSQIRCAKDGYRADRVRIRNFSNAQVVISVGRWVSRCGRAGSNTGETGHTIGSGQSITLDFEAVDEGHCREMFIYNCRSSSASRACQDLVTANPE